MNTRCRFAIAACALAGLLSSLASADTPLTTVHLAGGLSRPLFVTAPPGDTSRIFVVEQFSGTTGRIRIFDLQTNTLHPTPFLSVGPVSNGNEQGLLGLAFHPDFAQNGYFYVYFTDPSFTIHIQRYTVSADPNTADPNSAYPILSIAHPSFSNHNGGWIAFGPDGYLYAGVGDGGSGFDPNNHGQSLNILLAKLLRIDVNRDDFPADPNRNYGIPADNPFVGVPNALPEIWAYGLRNPWRDSFDRETGDLYIGDVGQNAWEEVDFQPAGSPGGLNYGWRCMEGLSCTGLSGCTCNGPTLTLPFQVYDHSGGKCAIIGGYVYRGFQICDLRGTYFYADECSSQIWSLRYDGHTVSDFRDRTAELGGGGGFPIVGPTSFGEDARGELYITAGNGGLYQIRQTGPHKGDLNNDGVVNFADIDAFVLALADPAAYQAQYGIAPTVAGDLNCDGLMNFDDINPFVALLTGN